MVEVEIVMIGGVMSSEEDAFSKAVAKIDSTSVPSPFTSRERFGSSVELETVRVAVVEAEASGIFT